MSHRPLHIVQVLPELNSGGVERGTLEFSRYLIEQGHRATVISNGGRLVDSLLAAGAHHICIPVHKKSLLSLRWVKPLRQQLLALNPDIIHLRSRLPAWLVWLAIGRLPKSERPALVSTFHGLYSSNRYSEIMGCGDQVIAVSNCVRDYILANYSRIPAEKIQVIHRGVDTQVFTSSHALPSTWSTQFFERHPQCRGQALVVMPGRITQWKGHQDFIEIMAILKERQVACHGLIVGGAEVSKQDYFESLKQKARECGLESHMTFVGHSDQIQHIYRLASVVCNFSNRPEPFGRTVIEALALGVPVVAYDNGGPAESLRACFPQGLVPDGHHSKAADRIAMCLGKQDHNIVLPEAFTLRYQAEQTLGVYRKALELV